MRRASCSECRPWVDLNRPIMGMRTTGIGAIPPLVFVAINLLVAAKSASFQFKGRNVSPAEAGRTLNVRYLVEGSVRPAGDRLRGKGSEGDDAWTWGWTDLVDVQTTRLHNKGEPIVPIPVQSPWGAERKLKLSSACRSHAA
jgi:hypothetical protein